MLYNCYERTEQIRKCFNMFASATNGNRGKDS